MCSPRRRPAFCFSAPAAANPNRVTHRHEIAVTAPAGTPPHRSSLPNTNPARSTAPATVRYLNARAALVIHPGGDERHPNVQATLGRLRARGYAAVFVGVRFPDAVPDPVPDPSPL